MNTEHEFDQKIVLSERDFAMFVDAINNPKPPTPELIAAMREYEQQLETALLSEAALSEGWSRPEEEEAWTHLQEVRKPEHNIGSR
jgi:hypothetical protein